MSFQSLPNEVVAHILHTFCAPEFDSKPALLRLRLVCRQFDDHASRIVLQASSAIELDIGRKLHWRPSIEWMLITKARIQRLTEGPFAFIHDAAEYLLESKLIPQLTEDDALVAACRTIVAVHEPSWIVNHLVTWEPDNQLPQSLLDLKNYARKQSGMRWEDKVENPEAFYGMMQLVLACGDGSAIESAISKRANGAPVESIDFHPVFGDAMRSAIVLEQVAGIRALLQHGIDPSTVHIDGKERDTLVYAAEMNREEAVKTILTGSKNIQVNSKGRLSHTTLGWAARRGWTEIARLLLERDDIDPEVTNRWTETPLAAAARHDHVEIARLLLSRTDFKPPFCTERYCPLWMALDCGATNVVRLFLDRFKDEININEELRNDHTALSLAVDKGFTPLVRMLLEVPGIEPDQFDSKNTLTPLARAVMKGHTEIVRVLLNFNVNLGVKVQGKILEQIALEQNHEEIFELLAPRWLEAGDSRCRELLHLSLSGPARAMAVRVLTKSPQFRQNNKDVLDRLLLQMSAKGVVPVVRELLRHDEVDPNYEGGKPLVAAIVSPSAGDLLSLFLARKDLKVNMACEGKTALLTAVGKRNTVAMKMLMTAPGINVNLCGPDRSGREWTFKLRCREAYPEYYLSCKRPFRHRWSWKEQAGQTNPLLAAAAQMDEGTAPFEILYDDPRTDRNVRDKSNRTILWWAVNFIDRQMVRKILDSTPNLEDIINAQDEHGWAPIHIVANNGFMPISKALLRLPEIDPNVATKQGWTALHMAMVTCSKQLTRMLLSHPKIDTSLKLDDGRTAFELHEGCECEISSIINNFKAQQTMANEEHQDTGLIMVSRPAVQSHVDAQESGP